MTSGEHGRARVKGGALRAGAAAMGRPGPGAFLWAHIACAGRSRLQMSTTEYGWRRQQVVSLLEYVRVSAACAHNFALVNEFVCF